MRPSLILVNILFSLLIKGIFHTKNKNYHMIHSQAILDVYDFLLSDESDLYL